MPKKELAKGYTTGTCAQAATRAAMQMLFTGEKVEQVSVELPQGEKLQLDITDIQRKYTDRELPDMVSCAVKKNSGDDPDITNGVLVYSQVRLSETGQIHIDGSSSRASSWALSMPAFFSRALVSKNRLL